MPEPPSPALVTFTDKLMAYLGDHPGAGVPELADAAGVTYERARLILRAAEAAGTAERFRRTPRSKVWSWRAFAPPAEGSYRCAECGHGRKLWAWAGANIAGPLAANGWELEEHHWVDEWGIHEDSIDCTEHPGAVIEMLLDGVWHRWWSCPRCDGSGKTGHPADRYRHSCPGGIEEPGRYGPVTIHKGWRPADEVIAMREKR